MKRTLSVVINTKNAQATLNKALRSVSFADQVVVVDMHSTDDTVQLAKHAGAEVFTHKDVGFVEPARNYALSKAKSEWILVLDADEEIKPELRKRLEQILAADAAGRAEADVYYLPRQNIVFGHAMEATGWWPDYQIRFFRSGAVTWGDEIHSVPLSTGKVLELPPRPELAILHHNYNSVSAFLQRLDRYTSVEAEQAGEWGELDPAELIEVFKDEWLARLFAKQAHLDGGVGIGVSFLQAVYPVVVLLKRWELSGIDNPSVRTAAYRKQLGSLIKDLRYWHFRYQLERATGLRKVWLTLRKRLEFI